jgi:hypothetical protein
MREFAFEPREGAALSDLGFKNALDAVSDWGRLAWSEAHLYYDVARRVRRKRLLHRLRRRPLVSISFNDFEYMLQRWTSVHGSPPGRLQENPAAEVAPDGDVAREVEDYAFEQVVVCDHDRIADLLIANGFHGENRCVVFSFGGYPPHAFETLMPVLRRNPPARVIAVHDADTEGCDLATRIAEDARWFGGIDGVEVIDAGLRPADAKRFRGLFLEGSPMDSPASASPDEREWLVKFRLDLEAVRPRALMGVLTHVLRHGVGQDRDGGPTGDDGGLWVGGIGGDDDDPG